MRLLHILVATLASILSYVGANGFPKRIPGNTIFAQMDGQIYKAKGMQTYQHSIYPSWMQQARILEGIAEDLVYLRPHTGSSYEANLRTVHSGATGSSSHSSSRTPVSVRVHIDKYGHHIYYRAENFQIEPFRENEHIQRATDEYPRENYIYIARRGGPIYSAPMIDYTPYIGPHHLGTNIYHIPDADGLRVLIPNNNIFVLMDGRIYKTKQITMRHWLYCPVWFQQERFLNMIDYDSIYIRPRGDFTYEASLLNEDRSRLSPARTHNSTPRAVRVHIVYDGSHTFYTAGGFNLFPVPHEGGAVHASHEYPPKGYIYIARKRGPVYCAPLIEFTPPQGHTSSDEALHLAIDL